MKTFLRALPQLVVVALGVWLMIAPAALGYTGTTAESSDRFVGPVIASIAFVAASEITRPIRWINVAGAVWLLLAPWLLGFPGSATANSMVVGALVAALSPLGKADMDRRFGGGWTSLTRPQELPDTPPE